MCVLGCREQSHTTRERAWQGLVHGVAAASYGYAEQKNYCELGVERMSRKTACSPSTRVCARWGRRRSRTAASVLDVRWPETEKTRMTSWIRSAVVRFLWRRGRRRRGGEDGRLRCARGGLSRQRQSRRPWLGSRFVGRKVERVEQVKEQAVRKSRGAAWCSPYPVRSGEVATVARCTVTTGAMPCVRCVRAVCYVRVGRGAPSLQLFLSCNTTSLLVILLSTLNYFENSENI